MRCSLNLIMVLLLFFGSNMYCQQDSIGVSFKRPYIEKDFQISKLFYKGTNTQVSEETYKKLMKEKKKLFLEKVVDEEGNVTRYYYNPNTTTGFMDNMMNLQSTQKDDFPNFKFTTVANETIELSKLEGKLVILRFEFDASTFRFKKHEIQELDDKINALEHKTEVKAILIFIDSKDKVLQGFDRKDSNFTLVADGQNFVDKYGIMYFPSTLVLDQNGNLIGTFRDVDDIDLEAYLKNKLDVMLLIRAIS